MLASHTGREGDTISSTCTAHKNDFNHAFTMERCRVHLKRFFLARGTILTLISLSLAAMVVASLVPQSFLLSPQGARKWREDYPILAPLTERLGLDHLYTHPVFAALLLLVVISLGCSCLEQFRAAWRRTFASTLTGEGAMVVPASKDIRQVVGVLQRHGYRTLGGGSYLGRRVKHPWGFWGNFLLHGGMLVVIGSSLLIALTQQRGLLHLVAGESFQPGQQWLTTEKGLLAKNFTLDRTIRLDDVGYDFRPGYGVKNVISTLSFLDHGHYRDTRNVGINDIYRDGDLRIYQTVDFGHAFSLEITDPAGNKRAYQLLLAHPTRPERASYEDYPDLLPAGAVLRLKYFADPAKRSFATENPLLVVRVDNQGRQEGQVSLLAGSAGNVGGYQLRLLKVDKWAGLIVVKLYGIGGVFFGFFLLILGGVLHYFTPPREVLVQQGSEGELLVSWRGTKFADFYRDEFDSLEQALTMGESRG
jgi:hypothetical protein